MGTCPCAKIIKGPKICCENILKIAVKHKLHSCPKLKLQPVLSFSSFVDNPAINEHKNMKLRENICYEIIY